MKTVNFLIFKDEDDYLIATATNAGIVTQGIDFNELMFNIREATELFFEEEIKDLESPSPYFNITYTDKLYA